jgi:lipoprotein-anchoring transpeptidase ErfK/SrfK
VNRTRVVLASIAVFSVAASATTAANGSAARSDSPSVAVARRNSTGWTAPTYAAPSANEPPSGRVEVMVGRPPIMLVEEQRPDGWLRVLLPTRADAQSSAPAQAWIRSVDVNVTPLTYAVTINRSKHRLVVMRRGRVVRSMRVAVGGERTSTPAVVTFIAAVTKPEGTSTGPLGPFTLELAAWSTVLADYSVNGTWFGLVIQGTNCPATCLGRSVTHGSVRVSNDNVSWLARYLPLGTPVTIT